MMTSIENDQPVFAGTPDQWWEQAEQITEAEAAERALGSWYIVAETRAGSLSGSYRVATPTLTSNKARQDALGRRIWRKEVRAEDISPTVRLLIRVPVEQVDWLSAGWMTADLVMADRAIGSDERVLWRRARTKWAQVLNGGVSVTERTMSQLRPAIATITE